MVNVVEFMEDLPIYISGSSDNKVIFWNSDTLERDLVLDFEMGRVWCIKQKKNLLIIGFDDGYSMITFENKGNYILYNKLQDMNFNFI